MFGFWYAMLVGFPMNLVPSAQLPLAGLGDLLLEDIVDHNVPVDHALAFPMRAALELWLSELFIQDW